MVAIADEKQDDEKLMLIRQISGLASNTWVSLPAISGLTSVTAVPANSRATTVSSVRRWGVMYFRSCE